MVEWDPQWSSGEKLDFGQRGPGLEANRRPLVMSGRADKIELKKKKKWEMSAQLLLAPFSISCVQSSGASERGAEGSKHPLPFILGSRGSKSALFEMQ